MSEPFIAEIRIFAGNFAPRFWAFCDGQLLPISQNTALFSLVGTTYGGDGRTSFGLPNLKGRAPMHPGRGPGLTSRRLGQWGGQSSIQLSTAQIPNHDHDVRADEEDGESDDPNGKVLGVGNTMFKAVNPNVNFHSSVVSVTGGNQPHNNEQPYLALNFIIALQGLYPQRS